MLDLNASCSDVKEKVLAIMLCPRHLSVRTHVGVGGVDCSLKIINVNFLLFSQCDLINI